METKEKTKESKKREGIDQKELRREKGKKRGKKLKNDEAEVRKEKEKEISNNKIKLSTFHFSMISSLPPSPSTHPPPIRPHSVTHLLRRRPSNYPLMTHKSPACVICDTPCLPLRRHHHHPLRHRHTSSAAASTSPLRSALILSSASSTYSIHGCLHFSPPRCLIFSLLRHPRTPSTAVSTSPFHSTLTLCTTSSIYYIHSFPPRPIRVAFPPFSYAIHVFYPHALPLPNS